MREIRMEKDREHCKWFGRGGREVAIEVKVGERDHHMRCT